MEAYTSFASVYDIFMDNVPYEEWGEYLRGLLKEYGCVTLNSLRLYKELGLKGGVLKIGSRIVAFSVGEPLCSDTFVVHIEKAFPDVEGAYPMINQQFVQHECMDYLYVNREEDTGAEGLRKAKLSYRPVFLVNKGIVTEKAENTADTEE